MFQTNIQQRGKLYLWKQIGLRRECEEAITEFSLILKEL